MINITGNKNPLFLLSILSIIVFCLLIFSSTVKPYGFFIDELYFIACSKRLAWGYIDQPPLSLLLLAPVVKIFGPNIIAIRVLPALCCASTVFITGLLVKKLGGSLISMLLASFSVALLPIFLVFTSFYSMNAYEPLLVASVLYFLVSMIQEDDPKYWIHVGILSGIALEMKHTFVLYGFALILGLLIYSKRKLLFNRWILWGGLACFLLVLPNLVWQVANDFPSLELYRNSFSSKNIEKRYLQVILEQVFYTNPAGFPLWITGLIALFFRHGKPYRLMLFGYLFLITVMVLGHSSRPDRIASIYIFFLAFRAITIENQLKPFWRKITQSSIAVMLLIGGVLLTPVFCPILPPQQFKKHINALGVKIEIEEGKKGEPIPQWIADRLGWKEMASAVSSVYMSLPESEKRNCVIVSDSYGPAGAMEIYAGEFGLPPVYGTHNSFHSWGPPSDTVKTYIGIEIDADGARSLFESVEVASVYYCPDCTRPQREVPIYVMRNPVISVEKMWPEFKEYH